MRRGRRRRSFASAAVAALGGLAVGCGGVGPAGTGRWALRAGLRTARDDFGLAAAGGRLYAVGGMTGERGNDLDTVEVFDPAANAWSAGPRLPVGTSSLRAVPVGQRLIAVGGSVGSGEVAEARALDPRGGAWSRIAPLRRGRMGHGLAALGARAIAAGGLTGGEPVTSVEVYDAERDAWSALAPLPQPRFNLTLAVLAGRAYAMGGSGPDRQPSTAVFVYDPASDRWSEGPRLPQPLSNFGAAVHAGRIHVVLHKHHFALGARAAEWDVHPPPATSRHGLGLEALGGALYAVGGCSEDPQRDLATVEAYRP